MNVCGTLKLLVEARDAGVERVVFSSSSSVYGDTPTLPKQEDMNPMPRSPYALSKLTGEYYCRMFRDLYGLKTFALRYFNVFGPRQKPDGPYAAVIPLFMAALLENRPPAINGDGEQSRDFTFVANAVEANIRAMFTPVREACGRVFNVACGDRYSINQLFRFLAELAGSGLRPEYCEERAGDIRDSLADISASRKLLGYDPKWNFREGLKSTWEWFCATHQRSGLAKDRQGSVTESDRLIG